MIALLIIQTGGARVARPPGGAAVHQAAWPSAAGPGSPRPAGRPSLLFLGRRWLGLSTEAPSQPAVPRLPQEATGRRSSPRASRPRRCRRDG